MSCCRFHSDGGTRELVCGDDLPDQNNRHSRRCAYLGGGDCTCGAIKPDPCDYQGLCEECTAKE